MGGSKSKPDPNEQRNAQAPHNQRPAEPNEVENMPSHEFDAIYNKSPLRDRKDHSGFGERMQGGQGFAKQGVRDNQARNSPMQHGENTRFAGYGHEPDRSPVHRGEATRFARHGHGPEKSPVDRGERRQAYGKDDESGKIPQINGRFANQRGGSPQRDEKSEQVDARNQTRFGHERRFSKNDEQLIQQGRFQADAEVSEEGKYRL